MLKRLFISLFLLVKPFVCLLLFYLSHYYLLSYMLSVVAVLVKRLLAEYFVISQRRLCANLIWHQRLLGIIAFIVHW